MKYRLERTGLLDAGRIRLGTVLKVSKIEKGTKYCAALDWLSLRLSSDRLIGLVALCVQVFLLVHLVEQLLVFLRDCLAFHL